MFRHPLQPENIGLLKSDGTMQYVRAVILRHRYSTIHTTH